MSRSLWPIEISCDAPPYPIVRACRHIDFHTPEDVRWLRLSAFRGEQEERSQDSPRPFWKMLWKKDRPAPEGCTCGSPLPELRLAVFTFATGEQTAYLLGQCPHCYTIFWDER